jgi:hypothetical protein
MAPHDIVGDTTGELEPNDPPGVTVEEIPQGICCTVTVVVADEEAQFP